MVLNNPAGYLVSGKITSGAGSAIDTRHAANYAYVTYQAAAESALVEIQASVDTTGWNTVGLYTAVAALSTAQIAGYYPYVRAAVNAVYSGGGNTGAVNLYYAPGLV